MYRVFVLDLLTDITEKIRLKTLQNLINYFTSTAYIILPPA